MAEQAETVKKAEKAKRKCLCSAYAIVTTDGDGVIERGTLGCDAETSAKFAPGHDARLKSMLIKAGAVGATVIKSTDEGDIEMTAVEAAKEYGFADTVAAGVERHAAKLAVKAEKAAARVEAKQAQRVAPGPAKAKVGRKTYEGTVLDDGLTFEYSVAVGAGDDATEETRSTTKFKIVIEEAAPVEGDVESLI